jgi:hypothetical protein
MVAAVGFGSFFLRPNKMIGELGARLSWNCFWRLVVIGPLCCSCCVLSLSGLLIYKLMHKNTAIFGESLTVCLFDLLI